MKSFSYNDIDFVAENVHKRWDISYTKADGKSAYAGAGLFEGVPEKEIEGKLRVLIRSIFPVGIKVIGLDLTHPNLIGDLKIIGPDITHPNFIYWDKESSSFPK